jgi:hypothetical protein
MDILYYSNYCENCKKVLQFITKNSLIEKIMCISIDKRRRDPRTGQYLIQLENGREVVMPPNVHSVPALLLIKDNYRAIFGGEITAYLEPPVSSTVADNGEPNGYILGQTMGSNIISEQYTLYDMTPEELSAKGKGRSRQMYNYVSANYDTLTIQTPPDTYRPDKLDESATIDNLQQKRNSEIPNPVPPNILGI